MKKDHNSSVRTPSIMKYSTQERSGIQSISLNRHIIGFVVRGVKIIYTSDASCEAKQGEMFYLPAGKHYVEDIPEPGKAFEQITLHFSAGQFSRGLSVLSLDFGLAAPDMHSCEECRDNKHIVYPAWRSMRSFFTTLNQYLQDGMIQEDPVAERLKMAELVYLIISNPSCCIQARILEHCDNHRESFEQIIHNNIFTGVSIDDLARLTHKSLTSFKKEFKRRFHEPPHQWMIKQRLTHARLLLISSSKSVAEVGVECNFPNTSHFIKLFRKEFSLTPAVYRNRHLDGSSAGQGKQRQTEMVLIGDAVAV